MGTGLIHFPARPATAPQGYHSFMTQKSFIDNEALAAHYPLHVDELRKRHDIALENAGASHAVIFSGAPQLIFLDDYHYPFKANPHFVSWLPLTTMPFCYLVYSPGEKPILVYFQEQDYWHSPATDPSGYWTASFDVRVVHDFDDVAANLPGNRSDCIFIGEVHDEAHAFGIERVNPTTAMNTLHFARGIKTGYEIECMRQSSLRAAHGHVAAEKAFRDGKSEFDIHLSYCRAVDHTDYELPYSNIVALNKNGAVLHYQNLQREVPKEPRSFLLDAGAQVHRYASDITRTHAFRKGEFADLVTDFDQLQRDLVAEVKTGVDYADLHLSAHRKIGGYLNRHGFATGSEDALVDQGVTSAFFPHGLGHLLGLQVHDVGGFMADDSGSTVERPSEHPFLRLTRLLQTDMVLTIEPGIYVIDMLLKKLEGTPGHAMVNQDRVDMLRPCGGIRIEDDVRVLDGGSENLTRDAFASIP